MSKCGEVHAPASVQACVCSPQKIFMCSYLGTCFWSFPSTEKTGEGGQQCAPCFGLQFSSPCSLGQMMSPVIIDLAACVLCVFLHDFDDRFFCAYEDAVQVV